MSGPRWSNVVMWPVAPRSLPFGWTRLGIPLQVPPALLVGGGDGN
ncbi:MAG: hypothetical protein R2932_07260 [Caldilineaceae bacterium]